MRGPCTCRWKLQLEIQSRRKSAGGTCRDASPGAPDAAFASGGFDFFFPLYRRRSLLLKAVQPSFSTVPCKYLYSLANPVLPFLVFYSPIAPQPSRSHGFSPSSNSASLPASLRAISFRIRTSEKLACNSRRIRTYKTQDLKPFRIRTYKKTGGGGPLNPETQFVPLPSHHMHALPCARFQNLAARKNEPRRTLVRKHVSVVAILVLVLSVIPLRAQAPAVSQSDLAAIHQIREEGFDAKTSKVMEIISYLSDVYGPRLTNSPDMRDAAKWTTDQMKAWQLSNVHLEPWAFGRGWSNERTSVQVIAPHPFPLIAYAKAWTPGTNGAVTADAVYAPITKEEDFAKYKGQLKGKFVLTEPIPESPERFDPQAHRYTDAELAELSTQPVPGARNDLEERIARFRAQRAFQLKVQQFLVDEGAAVWVEPSRRR